MGYDLTNIFVFVLFSILFVIIAVSVLSRLLRPNTSPPGEPSKGETYECGEPAIGSSWVRFDIRFYTVALIFIIFDVEVAFLYPWGVVFEDLRKAGLGIFIFMEMFVFVAILVVGFTSCWKKGDLDWVKSSEGQRGFPVQASATAGSLSASEGADFAAAASPHGGKGLPNA